MNTKQQILKIMRESEDHVSGQLLSEKLSVSRTAVWKAITKLREEGYPIEAVTNKGYRLLSMKETDILNAEEIRERLRTRWAGQTLFFFEKTGSTNDEIFRLSDEGKPSGTLAVAAEQTDGKGRRGRTWVSVPDANIYMSILLRPSVSPEKAPMVTLVMALAVCKAAREMYGESCRIGIKWPNDIVAGKKGDGPGGFFSSGEESYKKICGILTQMRMEEREIRDVVIGTGVNVNQTVFPAEIGETASSLYRESGIFGSRAELTALIWKHFEPIYEAFAAAGSLEPLREEYEEMLVNRGRGVRVLDARDPFDGIAEGITDDGELLVRRKETGELCCVRAGEVSVRGVNGYV